MLGFFERRAALAPEGGAIGARLRLLRSRRIGPATWRRLLEAAEGDADAALALAAKAARDAGIEDWHPAPEGAVRAEMRVAAKAGAVALWCDDARFPPALAAIPDPPALLWVRGDVRALAGPAAAVVGARDASALGLRMARRLGAGLAEGGATVVSGLARGIDGAAHEAALKAGGTSVAVLAGGVDAVYPPEHAPLAARLAAEGGAVVSEAPMGAQARAEGFPRRNRIVTGLSAVVVVVEGALRSGSMASARLAAEQGREVMAVPGHPLEPRAAGPNALLREGAGVARGAADVLEALGAAAGLAGAPAEDRARASGREGGAGGAEAAHPSAPGRAPALGSANGAEHAPSGPRPAPGGAPAAEASARPAPSDASAEGGEDALRRAVLSHLSDAPQQEDALMRALGAPAQVLAPVLLALELDGALARLPGGRLVAR